MKAKWKGYTQQQSADDLVLSAEFVRDVLQTQVPFEVEWKWTAYSGWLVRLVGKEEWHKPF